MSDWLDGQMGRWSDSYTFNWELESISWRERREGDFESVAGGVRFVDVAHHVHMRLLILLDLAPQDRVVEEAVVVGVELAFHDYGFTFVDDVYLALGNHRQKIP